MEEQLYAGIDIGGTKISVLITDSDAKVLGRAKKKSKPEKGFDIVMERAAECVTMACEEAGIDKARLVAAGVGAPSPILPDGTAIKATNMGWDHVPLAPALKTRLGIPVFAENDCNVGTFGEYALHPEPCEGTLIGLFMGTGLGGGIVRKGELLAGDNSMASEIGHMTVLLDGRLCGCGKHGCVEAYASKRGMGYAFKKAILLDKRTSMLVDEVGIPGLDNVRSSVLRRCWEEGDEVVREALTEAARYLGVTAGNLITLLGPTDVVFGGGVFDALGKYLLPLVQQSAREHAFPHPSFADTTIELATLGDDAVALGAMAYARARLQTS